MLAVTWRRVARSSPGPVALAAWIAVTLPAPLVHFEATHLWEEDQPAVFALLWTLGALPVFAGLVAAKWTWQDGSRRGGSTFLVAVVVATLVGAALLGVSMAVYRWVVPLQGAASYGEDAFPSGVLLGAVCLGGVLLAAVGAAVGSVIGRLGTPRSGFSERHGYLIGGLATLVGVLLAPVTVQLGAEDSTRSYDMTDYGEVGPSAEAVTLPAAGRYAILGIGDAPQDPDCRISGAGLAARSADAITTPPADYGSDVASYAWVASVTVPAPGTYSMTCRSSDERAFYSVWKAPDIGGAVGKMITWPVGAIWLLGAVPGLLILADTATRRRARREDATAPA